MFINYRTIPTIDHIIFIYCILFYLNINRRIKKHYYNDIIIAYYIVKLNSKLNAIYLNFLVLV